MQQKSRGDLGVERLLLMVISSKCPAAVCPGPLSAAATIRNAENASCLVRMNEAVRGESRGGANSESWGSLSHDSRWTGSAGTRDRGLLTSLVSSGVLCTLHVYNTGGSPGHVLQAPPCLSFVSSSTPFLHPNLLGW